MKYPDTDKGNRSTARRQVLNDLVKEIMAEIQLYTAEKQGKQNDR